MPTIDQAYQWLIALSPIALYGAAFVLAYIENIIPPFPSDVFIGLCAFIAAPGDASLGMTYASVLAGNISGAATTYWIGRRYGAAGLHARLEQRGMLGRETRLEAMYAKYGSMALFLARFLPGIRGIVPMVAGAFRLSVARTLLIVGSASALWYGGLTWIAYRVGGNWDEYSTELASLGRWGAIVSVSIAVLAIVGGYFAIRKPRERK